MGGWVGGWEREGEREEEEEGVGHVVVGACLFCCCRSLVQLAWVVRRMWMRELVMFRFSCSLAVHMIAGKYPPFHLNTNLSKYLKY